MSILSIFYWYMNTAKLHYCDPVSVSVLKPRILVLNTVGNPICNMWQVYTRPTCASDFLGIKSPSETNSFHISYVEKQIVKCPDLFENQKLVSCSF
jgi:hypothetical protein